MNNIKMIQFEKKEAVLLLGMFAVSLIFRGAGYALICIYLAHKVLFSSTEWVIKALFYAYIMRSLNHAIFVYEPLIILLFQWALFGLTFLRVLFMRRQGGKVENVFIVIVVFIVYAAIGTLLKSQLLALSLFKLVSFSVVFIVVYLGVKQSKAFIYESTLFTTWVVILALSVLIIPFPNLNYIVGGRSLQGILNHPQLLGVFLAILGGYFTYSWKKININEHLVQTLLLMNVVCLYLSRCRTGTFSFIACIVLCFFIGLRNRGIRTKFTLKQLAFAIIILVALVAYAPLIAKEAMSFVYKDVNQVEVSRTTDALVESRALLYLASMENIVRNPWIGIGFGSPTIISDLFIKYLPGTRVPISASMEKGFFVTAILEEMGGVGLVLTIFLFYVLIKPVFKYKYEYIPLTLTAIVVNLGEVTFFSANGDGVFLWICLFIAYHRASEERGLYKRNKMVVQGISS